MKWTDLAAMTQRPIVRVLRGWAVVVGSAVVGLRLIGGAAVLPWLLAVALLVLAVVRIRGAVLVGVPSAQRVPAAIFLLGFAALGGFAVGAPLIAAMERRHGPVWGEAVVLVAAALVFLQLRSVKDLPAKSPETLHRRAGAEAKLLEVRGVDFGYGRLQVLHDVHFSVGEGEMVALLGVNGAGKSTLLRAISGLGTPTAGSITFDGEDVTYLGVEARVRRGITQAAGHRHRAAWPASRRRAAWGDRHKGLRRGSARAIRAPRRRCRHNSAASSLGLAPRPTAE